MKTMDYEIDVADALHRILVDQGYTHLRPLDRRDTLQEMDFVVLVGLCPNTVEQAGHTAVPESIPGRNDNGNAWIPHFSPPDSPSAAVYAPRTAIHRGKFSPRGNPQLLHKILHSKAVTA